jgi:adhesin HecA-like repeat protein
LYCYFTNEGTLSSEVKFNTNGTGSFYQKGSLSSKEAILNNATIVHSETINRNDSKIIFGKNFTSFTNIENAVLNVQLLTNESGLLVNEGDMHLGSWKDYGNTVRNAEMATLVVDGIGNLSSNRIENKRTLTFNGSLDGRVDSLTNTGSLITMGLAVLTGKQLINKAK